MTFNNRNQNTRPSTSATIVAAEKALQSHGRYLKGIDKINAHANLFAESIALSGPVESSLQSSANVNEEQDDIQEFLNDQRTKLKLVTERNINSKRYVEALKNAVLKIKSDIQANNGNNNNNDEGGEEKDSAPDYETLLQTKLEFEKHNIEKNSIAINDEEWMRNVRQRLNEKVQSDGNDDDIEVEVSHDNRESELKCPLTGKIFQDPYRNKMCHHVYDKHAIQLHLRMKRSCPVMGCRNGNVSMSQLEPDEEMKLKVRRYTHLVQEKQRRNAMSQDYDVDDDDEEDGGENIGMTVIE